MSVISQNSVKDFYKASESHAGWLEINKEKIQTKDQALEIAHQCASDAQIERFKALGKAALTGGVVLLLSGVALLAFKITAAAVGFIAFPLLIIPPLHGLVKTICGVAVGGGLLFITTTKFSKNFFNQAKEQWNYANHLYGQAHWARLNAPTFPESAAG